MATRVVERSPESCRDIALRVLRDSQYRIESGASSPGPIRAVSVDSSVGWRQRPFPITVKMEALSDTACRVGVSFDFRWGLLKAPAMLWFFAGVAPLGIAFLTLFVVGSMGFEPTPWVDHCFGIGMSWLAFCLLCQRFLGSAARVKASSKLEDSLWQHLDPDGRLSEEVRSASTGDIHSATVAKWLAIGLIAIGVALLVAGELVPQWRDDSGQESASDGGPGMTLGERLSFAPGRALLASALLLGGLMVLLLAGPASCSWLLPHRCHWKGRFHFAYALWCFIQFIPAIVLILYPAHVYSMTHPESVLGVRLLRSCLVVVALFFQWFWMGTLLRQRKASGHPENRRGFFAPPPTRHEASTEEPDTPKQACFMARYARWIRLTYAVLVPLCYIGSAYVILTMVECLAALAGAEWPQAGVWRWPVLMVTYNRSTAGLGLLMSLVVGWPLLVTLVQVCRQRLSLRKRRALGAELAVTCSQAGLPAEPLAALKESLAATSLKVALYPDPRVNVNVERASAFGRDYFLWLSTGALRTLPRAELEALLWHECGHGDLLRRRWWREWTGLLSPWVPGYLDLAEDLYEHERQADLHVVERMGSARPLGDVLRRLEGQERAASQSATQDTEARCSAAISFGTLTGLWDIGLAGYAYPDLDQRLRWVDELDSAEHASSRTEAPYAERITL